MLAAACLWRHTLSAEHVAKGIRQGLNTPLLMLEQRLLQDTMQESNWPRNMGPNVKIFALQGREEQHPPHFVLSVKGRDTLITSAL